MQIPEYIEVKVNNKTVYKTGTSIARLFLCFSNIKKIEEI